MKKIHHANHNHKIAVVALVISLKQKNCQREKREIYNDKRAHQEYITIKNIYTAQPQILKTRPKRIEIRNKQFNNNSSRLKNSTFNNRITRKTINKEIEEQNTCTNQA